MKKILWAVLILALLVGPGCASRRVDNPLPNPSEPETGERTNPDNPLVTIELSSGGRIEIELMPDVAPNTVAHFISLIKKGYYDGLSFDYLLADSLVIAGNSPEGGPGYTVPGEFASSGFSNTLSHTKGTVSLYNGGHPDTGAGEFFILLEDGLHLDGKYAAFGRVIKGLDLVRTISRGPASDEGWALEPIVSMMKVTVDTMNRSYGEPVKTEVWDSSLPNPIVTMTLEAGGSIVIELLPAYALNTVRNFVALVESGFYDGLRFHRIIPGFMIQGGDPQGNGTGGPGHYIHGEFALNGFRNDLSHQRGILSMARSQPNDSAGSQFFITVGDASFLNGSYAAFGRVLEGMDVVDRIVNGPSDQSQNGLALAPFEVIERATVDTRGVEVGAPKLILP